MKLDGVRLRRERERQGLSQTDVVSLVKKAKQKITVGTVSNAENGYDVYPRNAKKICDALKVEIEDYQLPMEGDDGSRKGNPRSRQAKRSLQKSARVA
jgi:transcriptional regulator with XRE-family HTH domain